MANFSPSRLASALVARQKFAWIRDSSSQSSKQSRYLPSSFHFSPPPFSRPRLRRQWPLIGPRSSRSNSLPIARFVAVIFAWNSCNRNLIFKFLLFFLAFVGRERKGFDSRGDRRFLDVLLLKILISVFFPPLFYFAWKGKKGIIFFEILLKLILISAFYFYPPAFYLCLSRKKLKNLFEDFVMGEEGWKVGYCEI